MTYKCKICGGQTTLDTQNGIAICEYCGTKQALPLFSDNSERLLYESGNNYLLHSEYDKAENVFNQLLTIKPNTAELYWDLVLCKYGVTYVKDPKTGKYIPTCNRTHYTPIFSDENYKKAIELSSGEKKALFEDDAKTIDNIQKGIIAVSKKEKPFDIFISYKETDTNGNRTKDSIEAQKLYETLTEAGYKVFFSRITLEDKVGTEYEPYIYAALYSSKVMLTICSSKENLEAVWVKNEWSRFLGFRQIDNSKTLIPIYFDMDKAELPEEFALLPSHNLSKEGFEQELLHGIKKIIPVPITKAQRRKQLAKIFGVSAACVCVATITLAAIFLPGYFEDKKRQEQDNKFQESYLNAQTLFGNAQYEDAAKEFELLGDYKDSKYMLERCAIQPDYDAAEKLYHDGYYAQAAWAFEALGDYEDAADKKEQAELSWRKNVAAVTIGTLNFDNNGQAHNYFISANGSVETFKDSPGDAHNNIDIDSHGKIISIADGPQLYALHEDGYVKNSAINNSMEKDWQEIIQITTQFHNASSVALKSDGTLCYGSLINPINSDINVNWLKQTESWKNIVSLSWGYTYDVCMCDAVLAGVDSDGNVKLAYESYGMDFSGLKRFAESLSYVKKFNVSIGFEYITAVAIDYDGNVYIYNNGKQKTLNGYRDIMLCGGNGYDESAYVLATDKKKNLSVVDSKTVLLEDVVYLNECFAVVQSGKIYRISNVSNIQAIETKEKAKIYDQWLVD